MVRCNLFLIFRSLLPSLLGLTVPLLAFAETPPRAEALEIFPRRTLNVRLLGVNAFANEPQFGTVKSQLQEVQQKLKLRYIRVLFDWNDQIQPTPTSPADFSFYDDIARNIPKGVTAMPVVTGLPSWMSDAANWINGDPRKTFVELWVKKVVRRYGKRSRIDGFQIWNEPNMESNSQNTTLGVANNPGNYVAMLRLARPLVKRYAKKKKIVAAATTAINQNFPETLEYNEQLKEAGLERVADVWAFHYYGKSHERLYFGIASFLNEVSKPLWVTEIGQQGISEQRAYLETAAPLIRELVPDVKRFYIYQFTESTPSDITYGLKNLTPGETTSDLYRYLRNLPRQK